MNSEQQMRINNVLFAIHRDLSAPLDIAYLAGLAAYSDFHFQRVFKRCVGESVHQYIRRVRLEQAANLLLFNLDLTVLDIAQRCGFSSQPSFSQAFKAQFDLAPGQWRRMSQVSSGSMGHMLNDPAVARSWSCLQQVELPKISVVEQPEILLAYVRHQGYGRDIADSWQYLKLWCQQQRIPLLPDQMFGLHHSNPVFVPYQQCRYVAGVQIDTTVVRRGRVATLTIPAGFYARFDWQGQYGDLIPIVSRIYNEWLPSSGYRLSALPGYACYRKNPFLDEAQCFDLSFHIPVSLA